MVGRETEQLENQAAWVRGGILQRCRVLQTAVSVSLAPPVTLSPIWNTHGMPLNIYIIATHKNLVFPNLCTVAQKIVVFLKTKKFVAENLVLHY